MTPMCDRSEVARPSEGRSPAHAADILKLESCALHDWERTQCALGIQPPKHRLRIHLKRSSKEVHIAPGTAGRRGCMQSSQIRGFEDV